MLCVYCNSVFDEAIAKEISIIDGDCSSSCDDGIRIVLLCQACGHIAWAKTIWAPYATSRKWPDGIRIEDNPHQQYLDSDAYEYELVEDGEVYWLYEHGEPIAIVHPQ